MADGSIRKAVPEIVLDEIKQHVRVASRKGESGWRAARHTEDTLTGHWGGAVQTGWSRAVESGGYAWRWKVEYRKFSAGNQLSSEEKPTGADGIFQVEVERFRVG